MKTTQIENYISDVKENAKKTIATVVAVATIGTGALALASCDETPSVSANGVTTNNVTTEMRSSENLTFQDKMLAIATPEEDPEYFADGVNAMYFTDSSYKLFGAIKDYPYYNKNMFLAKEINISSEALDEIKTTFAENITFISFTEQAVVICDLSEEQQQKLFEILYNDYALQNSPSTDDELQH